MIAKMITKNAFVHSGVHLPYDSIGLPPREGLLGLISAPGGNGIPDRDSLLESFPLPLITLPPLIGEQASEEL